MLSLVYLDLFFNSRVTYVFQIFYIIYRKTFSVTSQVFQMNPYAKFNDYTQLCATAKCNYFVKINLYNQTFLFGLILIFFSPGLGLEWTCP